jgi:hypothetical protein
LFDQLGDSLGRLEIDGSILDLRLESLRQSAQASQVAARLAPLGVTAAGDDASESGLPRQQLEHHPSQVPETNQHQGRSGHGQILARLLPHRAGGRVVHLVCMEGSRSIYLPKMASDVQNSAGSILALRADLSVVDCKLFCSHVASKLLFNRRAVLLPNRRSV